MLWQFKFIMRFLIIKNELLLDLLIPVTLTNYLTKIKIKIIILKIKIIYSRLPRT